MSRSGFFDQIIGWFRAGYPDGVPSTDYVPMLALLRRQVTDEEAQEIACRLIEDGITTPDGVRVPISRIDAAVLLTKVLHELPTEQDLKRVRERVEAAGWRVDPDPLTPPSVD